MKITYDPEHNVGYIQFLPDMVGVKTIVISDAVNIDIAPDGSVYGME